MDVTNLPRSKSSPSSDNLYLCAWRLKISTKFLDPRHLASLSKTLLFRALDTWSPRRSIFTPLTMMDAHIPSAFSLILSSWWHIRSNY
ncbi:hypothetical protein CASFOL_030946 [Castilleja foliolosa]|uniref:Uncharacterized protein n=1 Tax=Castilleja foliolosa TaxID=1961234 RepID=A0ABD3C7D3_9LAMI